MRGVLKNKDDPDHFISLRNMPVTLVMKKFEGEIYD